MQAQLPGGYAQSYNLSQHKKVAGSYWADINQAKDGSIIAKPYSGDFTQLSATEIRPIFWGSTLNGLNYAQIFGYGSDGIRFFGTPGNVLRLIKDSIQKQDIEPIINFDYVLCLDKGYLMSFVAGKSANTMYFDGKKVFIIKPPSAIAETVVDSTVISRDLISGKGSIGYKTINGHLLTYQFNESTLTQTPLATYFNAGACALAYTLGSDSIVVNSPTAGSQIVKSNSGKPQKGYFEFLLIGNQPTSGILKKNGEFFIRDIPKTRYKNIRILTGSHPQSVIRDKFYNSYYIGNANDLLRIFPHIVQFPRLFNNANSHSINTLAQASNGTIFTGSYSTGLASITADGISSISTTMKFLNGGTCIGNELLFFSENPSSFWKYSEHKGFQSLLRDHTGFYLTPTRDKNNIMAGLAGDSSFGLLSATYLSAGSLNLRKIGPKQGIRTLNVVTLTEDLQGRIFFGRTSQGWGVYDPQTNKAETFLMQEQQTRFGAMSSLCDVKGFVWMGGGKGLWVVDAGKKGHITAGDAKRLEHPLLPDGITVSSMALWNNYLVAGAGRNLLLIDLKSFYKNPEKTIIRYLNPEETSFTADCEQNTMLVDHRDSSLWMATTDNLYQVDLKTWLKQPAYTINPTLTINVGENKYNIAAGQSLTLSPTQNSLHFEVAYQSLDNMPRYLQTAFTSKEDSLAWSDAATVNSFPFLNLRSGKYTFHLRILQSDGTITTHTFPITIRRFLWQQWWFWLLISSVIIGVSFYLFYLHNQKQLAVAEAKRVKAEAEALRSEQQRQLTSMQIKSLSTQFRPHFILNALNTVGAQLYDKPEVDAVLGQLGESIGIIFKNAQSGAIAHPLAQEWRLVLSVINIKQLELKNTVTVHMDVPEFLLNNPTIQVPMGILQIPVENALVHGLRNKETGSKDLWITATQFHEVELCVTVLDNGIGRKAAAAMGNYRSNGVGSRNMQSILDLLNPLNEKPITILYRDEPLDENGKKMGTEVKICIPENYQYER